MAVEFGFGIPQEAAWPAIKTFAQTAERLGLDFVWADDHLVGVPNFGEAKNEAWTVMSMVAGATDTIRVGHQVLCQSFRNPALLAKMAASLDYLSGGRLIFGIGAGWLPMEYQQYNYPFPSIGERLQQMRETIEVCKRLWTEEEATYQGTHYRVEDAYCAPKPAQSPHPPVMIGGSGEKVLLKAVAEYADIWNNFQTYIKELEHKLEVLKRHCDTVGRNFGDITIAQQTELFLGRDEAHGKALLEAAQADVPLNDPAEVALWGHPQRVIDEIGRHMERGVEMFWLSNPGADAAGLDTLERFGADVLPAFR